YDPDANPDEAKSKVAEAIVDAVKEIDQRKLLAVKRALASLGHDGFLVLTQAAQGMTHPVVQTMRDVMAHAATRPAIARLLDAGLIATKYPSFDPSVQDYTKLDMQLAATFRYQFTPLGSAVLLAAVEELGLRRENMNQWARVLEAHDAPDKIAEPEREPDA
ncbi:MAG: hypothetical protein HGA87_06020, partial [Desulfobulbaceae bacterium]|nr:hypothetical protein [Desulfobulbaceae bacterium]